MPGPNKKPEALRQRQNRPKPLKVIPGGGGRVIPDAPDGLLSETEESWDRYWQSSVSELADPDTDLEALGRLFWLYDEKRRAAMVYGKQRMVEGSQGQPVLNPMWKVISDCDKEIRMLEDRFGMTPKSRLNLGIAVNEMTRTLDDLNRAMAEGEVDSHEIALEDPRAS